MSIVNKSPLGIYIHIPFCKRKCDYCAFVSTSDLSLQKAYVDTLIREIGQSELRGAVADTVYIGGGTPSCLFRGGLDAVFCAVRNVFDIAHDAEITVECNPESANAEFIDECLANGVNRVSMGLQSSCDSVLKSVGRIHDFSTFVTAAEKLSRSFDNFSSDIMLGLPGQTDSDIDACMEVFDKYCTHASVYALTVEENTPLYDSGYSTDDDRIAQLYDRARSALEKKGFKRYEVSNFARDGKYGKHNKKYWNCEPYVGFGVASHGYDGDLRRFRHTDDICDYILHPNLQTVELTQKDRYNEYIMLRLRTSDGISLSDFRKRFGYEFEANGSDKLEYLLRAGYVIKDGGHIRISSDYMFVMNGIIEDLMLD